MGLNLKELIADLKAERAKGDKADQSVIDGLLDDIEPIASRDYATIKRLETKAAGKSTEDVAALEKQIETLTLERDTALGDVKKTAKDRDTFKTTAETKSAALHRLIRDEGLTRALVESGVKVPAKLKGAHAMLKENLQVDEEKGVAFALDKDGKRVELADYLKTWTASDDGKEYVTVPASSGGGSQGGGSGVPGAKTMTRSAFEGLDAAGKMAFSREHGTLTD
jgi:hypothetical protein